MSTQNASPMMRALAAAIEANVPSILWGDPGQGKTATLEASAKSWGHHVETVVGSNREATDFLGVMIEDDGVVRYSQFQWTKNLCEAEKGLLFLDELTTASPNTAKAMLRVLQERVVGETTLPRSVSIVAAANDPDKAVDGMDLPAPVANRLMHLDWVFDANNWLDNITTGFAHAELPSFENMLCPDPVSRKAAVAGAVSAYLRTRPNSLKGGVPEDPVKAGKAWPSPRSWTNAIEVLSHLNPDDEEAALLVVKGCVGQAEALQYFAFLEANDLHDPREVINNPAMVNWKNERADRLFALTQAVTALGLVGDEQLWKQALTVLAFCADGGKPDAAMPGAQRLLNRLPELKRGTKIPVHVRAAFEELLSRTEHGITV